MASRTRSLSQLVQTNLGRQIAGRLHRHSQAPVQTGRRVREGYDATRRSSLVWPGQPAPETPSEFPVEDDGLERLRRLRDALVQRQTDTGTPGPSASPAESGRDVPARSRPPSSHSSKPVPRPRPVQPESSSGSAAALQRSQSERPTPSSDAPPRRRAIVEELTPAYTSTAATPNDPSVQRKGAAAEPHESSGKPPPRQQRGRHNDKSVSGSSPAQLDTVRRNPDRAPGETQPTYAEQPADVSDAMGAADVQPAPEESTETPSRSDESVQRRPEPSSQAQTAPKRHQVEQQATSSQSPAPQVQRRRGTDTSPSAPDTSAPSRTDKLPAARHAEPPTEQSSLTSTRPTETTRWDVEPVPPEQGETQPGPTAPAMSPGVNVRRKPATNEETTQTADDAPGKQHRSTQKHSVELTTGQQTVVAHHDQTAVPETTAQGSGSQGDDQRFPEDHAGRATGTGLPADPASPEPSSRQERTRPDVSMTPTQHVQRRPEQTEQRSSTPAGHMQHSPAQLDADSTASVQEPPPDDPPTRVDPETLLAMAADAQERAMPARQSRQREAKQSALQVQGQEASVRTARPGRPETPPTVEEQPTVVQRAPAEDAAAARPEPTPESQTEAPPTADAADYDIDAMARDVYQILRRRLRVERERTRGWR